MLIRCALSNRINHAWHRHWRAPGIDNLISHARIGKKFRSPFYVRYITLDRVSVLCNPIPQSLSSPSEINRTDGRTDGRHDFTATLDARVYVRVPGESFVCTWRGWMQQHTTRITTSDSTVQNVAKRRGFPSLCGGLVVGVSPLLNPTAPLPIRSGARVIACRITSRRDETHLKEAAIRICISHALSLPPSPHQEISSTGATMYLGENFVV